MRHVVLPPLIALFWYCTLKIIYIRGQQTDHSVYACGLSAYSVIDHQVMKAKLS